jgi:hypothetical protein
MDAFAGRLHTMNNIYLTHHPVVTADQATLRLSQILGFFHNNYSSRVCICESNFHAYKYDFYFLFSPTSATLI